MNETSLSEKIKQLVNVSRELLHYSMEFRNLFDKHLPKEPSEIIKYKTNNIINLLRLQHCLYYFDVILNVNSLLNSKQSDVNKKDTSFFELIDLMPSSDKKGKIENILFDLKLKLSNNKMDVFRHKVIGHKDLNLALDVEIMYLNFINPELILITEQILDELDKLCMNHFNTNTSNPFSQQQKRGHQKLFDFFEKELEKIS